MKSCESCYWDYNGECVHENLEWLSKDDSFTGCDCIGWLKVDFEEQLYNTYEEILELIRHRKNNELEDILKFIKNQREN